MRNRFWINHFGRRKVKIIKPDGRVRIMGGLFGLRWLPAEAKRSEDWSESGASALEWTIERRV
jgi:hypothetical protein